MKLRKEKIYSIQEQKYTFLKMPRKNAKTWAEYENDRKDWHERQAALKNIGPKAQVWMQHVCQGRNQTDPGRRRNPRRLVQWSEQP